METAEAGTHSQLRMPVCRAEAGWASGQAGLLAPQGSVGVPPGVRGCPPVPALAVLSPPAVSLLVGSLSERAWPGCISGLQPQGCENVTPRVSCK